jgi:hypothetical protein
MKCSTVSRLWREIEMPDHLAPKAQALELSLWRPFPLEKE